MSLKRLEESCKYIQEKIEKGYDRNIPDDVSEAIVEYSSLLATSSEMVALAEMTYNEKLGELAEQYQNSKLSATDKKLVFSGKLKKEIYFVTLTERLNKALTHSIDALRSQLSYLKQEQINAKYQTT